MELDVGKPFPEEQTTGICTLLGSAFTQEILNIVGETERDGLERGIIFYQLPDNGWHRTEQIEGEEETGGLIAGRIKASDIKSTLRDIPESAFDVSLVHTHPTPDPTPSTGDIKSILDEADFKVKIESDFHKVAINRPTLDSLLQVSRKGENGFILTGMEIREPEDMDVRGGELRFIESLNDMANTVRLKQTNIASQMGASEEEKEELKQDFRDSYEELLERASRVLAFCHYSTE